VTAEDRIVSATFDGALPAVGGILTGIWLIRGAGDSWAEPIVGIIDRGCIADGSVRFTRDSRHQEHSGGHQLCRGERSVLRRGRHDVYTLCGLRPGCAIGEGMPTEEHERLLRREALDLALHTLRFVEDRDNVAVFLPPRAGYRGAYAQFFQRKELEGLLDEPIEAVLGTQTPLPMEIGSTETLVIDRLTLPSYFGYQFLKQGDSAVLVLTDLRMSRCGQSLTPSAARLWERRGQAPSTGDPGRTQHLDAPVARRRVAEPSRYRSRAFSSGLRAQAIGARGQGGSDATGSSDIRRAGVITVR
jgi:hypothetical protein